MTGQPQRPLAALRAGSAAGDVRAGRALFPLAKEKESLSLRHPGAALHPGVLPTPRGRNMPDVGCSLPRLVALPWVVAWRSPGTSDGREMGAIAYGRSLFLGPSV